jgi:hypothetical protein
MWFLLFIKQLPVMAIAELKEVVPPRMRHAHPEEFEHSRDEGIAHPQVTGEHERPGTRGDGGGKR